MHDMHQRQSQRQRRLENLRRMDAGPRNHGRAETNWSTQKDWAENLNFAGSSDWVLPSISPCADLYTAYGNLSAVAVFTNVQPFFYWSGTKSAPGVVAWLFGPVGGSQSFDFENVPLYAVAVRPGDVVASVPEPQTLALLALGATAVARRRRPG